ncbi:MAG TPA: hypothetical protein VLL05_21420 [Terriglobales bacterium]|nr:hypothetical protein [Terriglobales bacterium]
MDCRRYIAGLLLLFAMSSVYAHAGATLLLEEPYSYDGTFAGTGHVAVYLNRVCADSPFVLRRCAPGEQGVVLSRYHGIAGHDWYAIPLMPYLYAVELPEQVPLYADPKLVAFLRDQYRRKHLAGIIPDAADGETPEGPWVQLVGSSYDRTSFAFQIETSPERDDELIRRFNAGPNEGLYRLLSRNCADFVREIINFYYPGSLHRGIVGDLGVTTPKQIAKCLVKFSKHHPQLQSSSFVIPQVPGTVKRSKPVRGVVESAFKAKKYMAPLLLWHPAIVAGVAAAYFTGSGGFDPGKHALVFDPRRDLEPPMTAQQRREYLSRVELVARSVTESSTEEVRWPRLGDGARPELDESGQPLINIKFGEGTVRVGLTNENILSASESTEIAQRILLMRLREELRRNAPKVAQSDVHRDLTLLEELQRTKAELESPLAGTF